MNEITRIARDDRCPADSYTDMLEADTRPAPDFLLEETNRSFPTEPLSVEPYISEEFARLERERMWPNVWLFAAREDEMPEPGDTVVFEIVGKSFLLVRQQDMTIKAFYNACLHRGRQLRNKGGRASQLRCNFHGFTWNNDGSLKEIPCAWDFKHLEGKNMSLPEVRVNVWQGFIMITQNRDIPEFVDWVGPVLKQYERYHLDECYSAMWVSKRVAANWKATAEAFMEAWHSITTHPQLLPYLGDANTRYDHYGDNFNRAITPGGVLSPHITGKDQEYILEKYGEAYGGNSASSGRRRFVGEYDRTGLDPDDPFLARKLLAEANRKGFSQMDGNDYSDACDAELVDSFTYNIFPNFSPWIGFMPKLLYRWLPGDTPDWCTMEIRMLMRKPKDQPRPKAVEKLEIPDGEPFAWAKDTMGEMLAQVFDQDLANLPYVQKGMKTLQSGTMELGAYQDSRVRHFNETLMKYINGELPAKSA